MPFVNFVGSPCHLCLLFVFLWPNIMIMGLELLSLLFWILICTSKFFTMYDVRNTRLKLVTTQI
uniref:Putative ovule protein n=1 Tax=Solanum chacoense TaxID=4108 RepID=A0A0V0HD93_SOLCH